MKTKNVVIILLVILFGVVPVSNASLTIDSILDRITCSSGTCSFISNLDMNNYSITSVGTVIT